MQFSNLCIQHEKKIKNKIIRMLFWLLYFKYSNYLIQIRKQSIFITIQNSKRHLNCRKIECRGKIWTNKTVLFYLERQFSFLISLSFIFWGTFDFQMVWNKTILLQNLSGTKNLHFCTNSSSSNKSETTSLGLSVSGLKLPPLITNFWI